MNLLCGVRGSWSFRGFKELIKEKIKECEEFVKVAILPEILGKWYTRETLPSDDIIEPHSHDSTESQLSPTPMDSRLLVDSTEIVSAEARALDSSTWCYCKGEEMGEMIGCDNDACIIKWFHTDCLHITKIPKGKWFCPDCRRQTKKRNKTKS